ncbi:MAG: GspE/PulE family protein [Myxococcales bacterium]
MLRAAKYLFAFAGICAVAAGLLPAIAAERETAFTVATLGRVAAGTAGNLALALQRIPGSVLGLLLVAGGGSLVVGLSLLDKSKRVVQQAPAAAPMAVENVEDPRAVRKALLRVSASLTRSLQGAEPDIVFFLDGVLRAAIQLQASDVHLQPLQTGTQVAFRVNGVIEDVITFDAALHKRVVMRVKVLARLVTYVSDRPQDGHLSIDIDGATTDVRVSLLPTNHGEKIVLRIGRGRSVPELKTLGFPELVAPRFMGLLNKSQGLIFLTGPTGSGKTTTIYAALWHIKNTRGETTQIATIEDPIEYDLPFMTQTQVKPDAGLSFAQGLRSMLRQDPNVMMVGEIRDAETARIAIQAGLSGHLILTTIHAESAAGVFNRLIGMGVEPFLLASATVACVSQRLVRMLCPRCRHPIVPDAALTERFAQMKLPPASTIYEAVGCEDCGGRGYLGRTGLYEMLEVTPAVREKITARVPTTEIHDAAVGGGMQSLSDHGLALVHSGVTSLSEVLRVSG